MKDYNVSKSNEEGTFEVYEGQKMVYAPNGEVVEIVRFEGFGDKPDIKFQDGSVEEYVALNDLLFH